MKAHSVMYDQNSFYIAGVCKYFLHNLKNCQINNCKCLTKVLSKIRRSPIVQGKAHADQLFYRMRENCYEILGFVKQCWPSVIGFPLVWCVRYAA